MGVEWLGASDLATPSESATARDASYALHAGASVAQCGHAHGRVLVVPFPSSLL